jgi:hypothetical protein
MSKLSQVGAVIALLGMVLALIGLFPSTLGLDPTEGIGILQIGVTLSGFALLDWGAYIYAKATWFRGKSYTLGQTVGVRLTVTGLLFSAACGLADLLGFGSHPSSPTARPLLGEWQAVGFVLGFVASAFGVVIFALLGDLSEQANAPDDGEGER